MCACADAFCVQLDVWVGLLPVHRVLLDRQHEQLWALLLETLDTECAQAVATHNANNFTVRLGRLVSEVAWRHTHTHIHKHTHK